VGQFGLPDVIHCAGALGTSALGDEAELGSLARWRIRFARFLPTTKQRSRRLGSLGANQGNTSLS